MTNQFDIDETSTAALQDSMKSGEGIELPFPALYFWAINGNPALRQVGGPQYFGGWGSKAEQIIEACERLEKPLPPIFSPAEISTKDNKTYEAYIARILIVAPIAFRNRWVAKDGKQASADYVEGYRRHVQVLTVLGQYNKEAKGVFYFAPTVLSAKGYQAGNLLTTLKEFEKHIDGERRKAAPKVPANCFYRKLGTFGENPNVKMVGPEKSQSPITPICVELPEKTDVAKLAIFYVGKQTAAEMSHLLNEAQEWLGAWKNAPVTKRPTSDDDAAFEHAEPPLEEAF